MDLFFGGDAVGWRRLPRATSTRVQQSCGGSVAEAVAERWRGCSRAVAER